MANKLPESVSSIQSINRAISMIYSIVVFPYIVGSAGLQIPWILCGISGVRLPRAKLRHPVKPTIN